MSLFAVLSVDDTLRARLGNALHQHDDLAQAGSWVGLYRLVRERPVSGVIVDSERLLGVGNPDPTRLIRHLTKLRRNFPSVGNLVVARPDTQSELLFHLGCAGLPDLRLVRTEELGFRLKAEINHSLKWSAASRVTQALSSHVPGRHLVLIRRVLETLHRKLSADDFARTVGVHRPQLSQKLVSAGLPSVGRLLLWGRLLQSAVWLVEPGRTAESVSRQLEYSSGAAFRRALRGRLGATPTTLIEAGGLPFVLDRFLQVCAETRVLATAKVG
jgi:AraC-like DNA-binding protein